MASVIWRGHAARERMEHESVWWLYLVFFMIPLARILPRLIARVRGTRAGSPGGSPAGSRAGRGAGENAGRRAEPRTDPRIGLRADQRPGQGGRAAGPAEDPRRDLPPDKRVLGQMSLGISDYARIRDRLGMDEEELDKILADLEKGGLMRVERKSGLLGQKVELRITEEGMRRYHS